jgi:type I restriction enzyme M protein
MILHGVHYRKFDIKQEDTLEHPQHLEHRFEAIVANPPFSAQWSANQLFTSDDRFSQYGKLAPKSKADFAFVQHMIHHLAENGTMALVLPHGALFRGSAEAHIRKYLIEDRNYLDAVIGLPANIFYGTSIPTCILVFKKCRENPENVLFIDASTHFDKVKTQNMLREEDIDRIIATYNHYTNKTQLAAGNIEVVNNKWQNNEEGNFKFVINNSHFEIEKYSYVAPISEIIENDYNLNIPRYVDTFEEEEPIDITTVMSEIKTLEAKRTDLDKQIDVYFKELGLVF